MAEQQQTSGQAGASAAAIRLHEIAQLLRTTHHFGPEEQHALAELADELGRAWEHPTPTSPASVALAQRITHLAEALRHGHPGAPIHGVRQRLEEMALKMEERAPYGAAFARQLVD